MTKYTLNDIQKKRKEILLYLHLTNGNQDIIEAFEENKIYHLTLSNLELWKKFTKVVKIYLKGITIKNMVEIAKEIKEKRKKRYGNNRIQFLLLLNGRLYPLQKHIYDSFAKKIYERRYEGKHMPSVGRKKITGIKFGQPYVRYVYTRRYPFILERLIGCLIRKDENEHSYLEFTL